MMTGERKVELFRFYKKSHNRPFIREDGNLHIKLKIKVPPVSDKITGIKAYKVVVDEFNED